VSLTIRARLTLLYFVVLAASFVAFFWICDIGFRRSIQITVNDASRNNLEIVERVLRGSQTKDTQAIQKELGDLSLLWANGAIFEVAGPNGEWIFRPERFQHISRTPLLDPPAEGIRFATKNLDHQQYRIAQEKASIDGQAFRVDAAVPTEPFDQALDHFRLTEKRFFPLLVVLASLLGYWLSGRALAPVNRIIQSAEKIGVQDLSHRLIVPAAKDELRRLTETVNAMLGRIELSVKRIQQFTADASHDLRTPLTLIRTNAELALRRPRTEKEYREALQRILSSSEETTALIEALLTLARADIGASQLHFEPVELPPLLRNCSQKAALLALEKSLDFSESLSDTSLPVRGDAAAIERMVLALLDNAVKYTPTGGSVELRSAIDGEFAVVEVQDSGIGISGPDRVRIFDRFFRADQARSREVPGSGLGLSIARWVAEAHGGTIAVQSQLGQGSLFIVRLPMEKGSAEPAISETKLRSLPLPTS
jgi:two-component system, OmpR family, heavy metal sensor histidine kinase CusS